MNDAARWTPRYGQRAALILFLLSGCAQSAASRPAAVIPSGLGGYETDQQRTGAPPEGNLDPSPAGSAEALTKPMASGAPPSAPAPTGGVGEPAFYFKPTPKPAGIVGLASWYDDGPGLYVALPGGDFRGHNAVICGLRPWNCITVPVRTSCICTGPPAKVADLSPDLFRQFAALSRGIVKVQVEVLP